MSLCDPSPENTSNPTSPLSKTIKKRLRLRNLLASYITPDSIKVTFKNNPNSIYCYICKTDKNHQYPEKWWINPVMPGREKSRTYSNTPKEACIKYRIQIEFIKDLDIDESL